ncbi:energy transducer TonB [Marinicella rhabdoformis]|uniref:energy transducer TonB n=1 Tax=Marinicella rhabdoformis TaxID=2580566 RepID=UPI0012AEB6B2|nr:energy transducer TonB [Marinicella rhabdoformis]
MSKHQTTKNIILTCFLFYCTSILSQTEHTLDDHDSHLPLQIPTPLKNTLSNQNKTSIKEWVEIEMLISPFRTISELKILHSSENVTFERDSLKNINKLSRSFIPKKENGMYVYSSYIYRYDIFFDFSDNYDGKVIRGKPQNIESQSVLKEINQTKNLLIYFTHEVPEQTFIAEVTSHNSGDFLAIQIKKSIGIPGSNQTPYLKHIGFNTLQNKNLISYFEFYSAYGKYINYPNEIFRDKNGTQYLPATVNEHKPLADKTEYWTKRPHTAKPRFKENLHLFSNYYAELDSINYEGTIKLKSTVEATGLLSDTIITESSGLKRLDEITLKVLKHLYMIPAYKNHQNVADIIDFEIEFKR